MNCRESDRLIDPELRRLRSFHHDDPYPSLRSFRFIVKLAVVQVNLTFSPPAGTKLFDFFFWWLLFDLWGDVSFFFP